jgi:hypothetical protein
MRGHPGLAALCQATTLANLFEPGNRGLKHDGTSKRSFARRWMLLPLGLRKLLTAR